MKNIAIAFMLILGFAFLSFSPVTYCRAESKNLDIKINAKSAYMMDYNTHTEIISQNAETKLPIASMTKLATLAVVFDEINSGRLQLDDIVTISQNAADVEGSSAFLDAGSKYKVSDLIKTVVVVSANDSSVALAEYVAGSEDLFVAKMNKLVSNLHLTGTHFANCTGLPDPTHYSTAKDMAYIYLSVCENPVYKQYSKIWMEDFVHPSGRKTGLVNTNRLIKTYAGCDSGKTGHTSEAKYCLTASASRMGTRLVSVIIGAEDSKTRFSEVAKMFDYGFANYITKMLVNSAMPLSAVKVVGSETKFVELYPARDYFVFESKGGENGYSVKVDIPENIKAPIAENQTVGKILVVNQNNIVVDEIDAVVKLKVDAYTFGEIFDSIIKAW